MENTDNSNEKQIPKAPTLCTAGCGFYGSEAFNDMCSQCFKKTQNNSKKTDDTLVAKRVSDVGVVKSPSTSNDDTTVVSAIEKSRKHLRSPSPDESRSAPASSIASPAPTTTTTTTTTTAPSPLTSSSSSAAAAAASSASSSAGAAPDKPVQANKGRCFKCRLKVPLAKQAANKCRCGYVFCDNHRYPDRHDCDVDYAKMDREILAKNNPKLHERPKGGRSFQRIDSL